MESDKRESPRLDMLGDMQGEVSVLAPLTIREISRAGALVETSFPLQLNSLHEFRLELGGQTVVIRGRIAHCRIVDVDQEVVVYRAGLEFVEASDHVMKAVGDYIAHLQHLRGMNQSDGI